MEQAKLRPVGNAGNPASPCDSALTGQCGGGPASPCDSALTGQCGGGPARRCNSPSTRRCRRAQASRDRPVPRPATGRWRWGFDDRSERGSGTVLAAGLALVVITAMAVMLLLAQSAVLASRAASAADLAALAAADALRGISSGEPCTVAAEVAARHAATVLGCTEGAGQTIEVRTELAERSLLGAATGRARAGPPP
nr:Rv3654c family TadE-like protein [Arthrobacter oryzae]